MGNRVNPYWHYRKTKKLHDLKIFLCTSYIFHAMLYRGLHTIGFCSGLDRGDARAACFSGFDGLVQAVAMTTADPLELYEFQDPYRRNGGTGLGLLGDILEEREDLRGLRDVLEVYAEEPGKRLKRDMRMDLMAQGRAQQQQRQAESAARRLEELQQKVRLLPLLTCRTLRVACWAPKGVCGGEC